MSSFRLAVVTAIICTTLASAAHGQTTQQPTRAEYIAQADPICKAAFDKRLPKGGRSAKAQARGWAAVGRNIGRMARRLDRLPKPAADAELLEDWIGALRRFKRHALGLARGISHGNPKAIRRAVRRLNDAQDDRLDASRGFGFEVCR